MARPLAPTADRRGVRLAAAIAVAVLLVGATARAQPFPFDQTLENVTTTAPIASYVGEQVAGLKGGDREKVMSARVGLLAPISERGRNPSPAFLNAYAKQVNDQLLPVAKGQDPHAKLNAAIVAIKVAEQSHSTVLSPLIATLEADASPAVATFGLRAASNVIVYALSKPNAGINEPMSAGVLRAVEQNPDSDMIAMESYRAFTAMINDQSAANDVGPQVIGAATPRLIDAVHELMALRLKQFRAGDIVEPAAESPAFTFLATRAFSSSTAAQKGKTVNYIAEMMDVAADQLQALQAAGAATNRVRQNALQNMIKAGAQGLSVIASQTNDDALNAATASIRGLGGATPAADYKAAVTKAIEAARKSFPAPAAPANAPAAPASAPAAAAAQQ